MLRNAESHDPALRCARAKRHEVLKPEIQRVAETINGLYKTELIYKRGPWKNRESVELATLEWVHWFNHERLLEPIGHIPPAEAEAQYYRQLANTDSANIT